VFVRWIPDASMHIYQSFGDPTLGVERLYVTSAISQRPFTNASGYSNPEIDELWHSAAHQGTNEERSPYFHRIQEILLEEVPTLHIAHNRRVDAANYDFHLDPLWELGFPTTGYQDVWKLGD
jgi:peptide/nickel transport system substrate-binding protein